MNTKQIEVLNVVSGEVEVVVPSEFFASPTAETVAVALVAASLPLTDFVPDHVWRETPRWAEWFTHDWLRGQHARWEYAKNRLALLVAAGLTPADGAPTVLTDAKHVPGRNDGDVAVIHTHRGVLVAGVNVFALTLETDRQPTGNAVHAVFHFAARAADALRAARNGATADDQTTVGRARARDVAEAFSWGVARARDRVGVATNENARLPVAKRPPLF